MCASMRESEHGNGYVKIHRKLLSSAVFQASNKLLKVWIWCIVRANWQDSVCVFEGHQLRLKRGSFITGRFTGSKECKMRPKTFHNQLQKLAEFGNIIMKSDNQKTLIIIVNYGDYQGSPEADGQPVDNQWTTNGQPMDTDKEVKKIRSKEENSVRPESLSTVISLFKEKEYTDADVEGEKFWNYYESNGWRVGKNPMKNWRAAAANWNKNAKQYGRSNAINRTSNSAGSQAGRAAFRVENPEREVREVAEAITAMRRERDKRSGTPS